MGWSVVSTFNSGYNDAMKKAWLWMIIIALLLGGCNQLSGGVDIPEGNAVTEPPLGGLPSPGVTRPPLSESVSSPTPAILPSPTATPLPPSPTITSTPTDTPSPLPGDTPTVTPTPTFAFPQARVSVAMAHCRYGPATAYLHAADLYEGDTGQVWGRSARSTWLYVRFDKLKYACWVAPSVVDVQGDVGTLVTQEPRLPVSVLYPPPDNVRAVREGNQVTVSWGRVPMTKDDDRGYMLDIYVCQKGAYIWWPVSFKNQYTTHYTVTDEAGCPAPSGGKLAAVEKHGYTDWVEIPWPVP